MKFLFLAIAAVVLAMGCSPVKGERFWWNDQQQQKLDNNYELPEWPAETPLIKGEKPFVDKKFKPNEVERAQAQEKKQITAGIPRCGVPDPMLNPVPVKVAKWGGDNTPAAEKSPAAAVPPPPAPDSAQSAPAPVKKGK